MIQPRINYHPLSQVEVITCQTHSLLEKGKNNTEFNTDGWSFVLPSFLLLLRLWWVMRDDINLCRYYSLILSCLTFYFFDVQNKEKNEDWACLQKTLWERWTCLKSIGKCLQRWTIRNWIKYLLLVFDFLPPLFEGSIQLDWMEAIIMCTASVGNTECCWWEPKRIAIEQNLSIIIPFFS